MDVEDLMKKEKTQRSIGYLWEKTRKRILERDEEKCVLCGSPGTDIDHEIPLALGGKDEDSNLRTLCQECHRKKTRQDVTKINRLKKFKRHTWRFD